MKLASKYPTGTTDSVGHLFIHGVDMRMLVLAISSIDKNVCVKELLSTYEQRRELPKAPWTIKKCLSDIDSRKASIEGLAQSAVDFLPEYKDKNKQDFFVSLLSALLEVKEELIRQNPVEGT